MPKDLVLKMGGSDIMTLKIQSRLNSSRLKLGAVGGCGRVKYATVESEAGLGDCRKAC